MTREWRPTLLQILRGLLQLARDAASIPFARRKAIQFTCESRQIRGTFYYPKTDGRAPAILLLPTAFGLTPHEHAMASRLAREGYTTLVIAYSGKTTGAVVRDAQQRKRLEQIVVAGLRVLQADPLADAIRSAVIGLSLGGCFTTCLASAGVESAPKAVVVYYGMYPLPESEVAALHAPLLILQGENDSLDFVMNAKRVHELCVRQGRDCELVLYPGAGHQFDLFQPDGPAARDAWERTLAFLKQHLHPSLRPEASRGLRK